MLETHQQEAKTARDKRDREEIQQLKKQVKMDSKIALPKLQAPVDVASVPISRI